MDDERAAICSLRAQPALDCGGTTPLCFHAAFVRARRDLSRAERTERPQHEKIYSDRPNDIIRILPASDTGLAQLDGLGSPSSAGQRNDSMQANSALSTLHSEVWTVLLSFAATLIAVIAGWFLNEMSSILRVRREDRCLIGRALSELMEVRLNTKLIPKAMHFLRRNFPGPLPPEADLLLRNFVTSFIPNPKDLEKRYNDAVSSVAGRFPALAYELRSKDQFGPIVRHLRSIVGSDPAAVKAWLNVEDKLSQTTTPLLDDLILRLAKHHGRSTLQEIKSKLTNADDIPKEADQLAKEFIADVLRASANSVKNERPQGKNAATPPTTQPHMEEHGPKS